MKRETSQRQRPLFHEGPAWQQLDEPLQQQLVQQLAAICHCIASSQRATDPPSTNREEPDDRGKH
jgi:hypothetical protein